MDTITSTPPRLHVDLVMQPEDYASLSREASAIEVAQAFVIDCQDMAESAGHELRAIKARLVKVKEMKTSFVKPAKEIIGNAEALFDPAIKALEESERIIKARLIEWTTEQERIAAEARRKAEEEQRKARQEAERIAAAERAKAEELARAEREKAAAAEAARLKAISEGNARAAAAAAAEAAKAAEKAAAIEQNAEVKATQAVLSVSAAAPVITAPAKVAGFSMRDNWQADFKPGVSEQQAVLEIARAIAAGRTELAPMLAVDMCAAAKLAKALKDAMNVPGLVAVNRPVGASRGK